METIVDLSPFADVLVQLVGAALLAVGVWVAKKLADKLGLEADSEIRGYLMDAVENAVKFAEKELQEEADKLDAVAFKSKLLATGAQYVMTRVPDAVEHFNLTEEAVAQLVQAKLK